MSFVITNHCPNCGAPIWIQDPSPVENLPSPTYFTCGCKPEKNGITLYPKPVLAKDEPLKKFEVQITCANDDTKTILCD